LSLPLLDQAKGKAGRVSGEELAHKRAIDGQDRPQRLHMTHRCSIVVQTRGVKVLPASFLEGPPFLKQKSSRTVSENENQGQEMRIIAEKSP